VTLAGLVAGIASDLRTRPGAYKPTIQPSRFRWLGTPSPEDAAATREIVAAGVLLGIEVLDHLVVARGGYVSLRERRLGFG
jgi:hypothetical protein